ncbi:MAG: YdeI/OmpD-associated family protein, partial [Bacteroidales bacterium]|nr:YdeI/OmpD-associated family protein [Bacteroidales bacterium]
MPNPQYFRSRDEWRTWLVSHHCKENEVWLVYYKKHTGKPTVRYEEAVEEALCFGWIDTTVKTMDEERYMQKYTPRKKGSGWSKINRKRAEKMIAEGRMTGTGILKIEEAKKTGAWERAYLPEKDVEMPPDLKEALYSDKQAWNYFSALPPSAQKMYIIWVCQAKREETR